MSSFEDIMKERQVIQRSNLALAKKLHRLKSDPYAALGFTLSKSGALLVRDLVDELLPYVDHDHMKCLK